MWHNGISKKFGKLIELIKNWGSVSNPPPKVIKIQEISNNKSRFLKISLLLGSDFFVVEDKSKDGPNMKLTILKRKTYSEIEMFRKLKN